MKKFWVMMGLLLLLSSCIPKTLPQNQPQTSTNNLQPTVVDQLGSEQDQLISPTITSTPILETYELDVIELVEEDKEQSLIFSPLQGILITDLPQIISNPFVMPQIGKDDAHHGVDFSFYAFRDFGNISGFPVLSIFSGNVAAATENLPPYGNMIIIESEIPEPWITSFGSTSQILPSKSWTISPQLTCPDLPPPPKNLIDQKFSIYVLYAHLSDSPKSIPGDSILAGDLIGTVGSSGMSGNPHLHLEFRIGPSEFHFEPMGHYSSSLSQDDMKNYCIWRVSGWFIPINPMDYLLTLNSSAN